MKSRMRLALPLSTAGTAAPRPEIPAARRRTDPAPPQPQDDDALRPARGVFFAALLGSCLWLALLYTWLIAR